MLRVERLAFTSRWVRYHPADKLFFGMGLLLLALVLPPVPGSVLVLMVAVSAATVGAGIPITDYLRVITIPLAFLVSGAIALTLSIDWSGQAMLITTSPEQVVAAAEVSLRALAAVASLLLITLTTPIDDLVAALRRARLPGAICDLMLMILKFAFLALDTVAIARIAQEGRLGYTSFRRSMRSTAMLAAGLLPRLIDRAMRFSTGLEARGYQGDLRVLSRDASSAPGFRLMVVLVLTGIVAIATAASHVGLSAGQ